MDTTTTLAPGLQISRIVTGLWQIADMERHGKILDPIATGDYMNAYLEAGFSSFDMADHYGSSEIIAGTFKNRLEEGDRVQLFTKWVPEPGKIRREDVEGAIAKALDRMKQSSIELLQFHAWNYADPSWLDALFYLKELQEKGSIKHLGVTNFDAAHLRIALASGIPIVSNQVCYSLLDSRASGNMAKVCQEYGVKLLAFGTLAGGFLTARWLERPEPAFEDLTTWSQMKYKRFIDASGGWDTYQDLFKVVKKVADKHQVSLANIATRYILEQYYVAGVIIGVRFVESDNLVDNN
ncbi:MAG: aldo/keto reductase, partial [Flavobacteriaceae bacterium]